MLASITTWLQDQSNAIRKGWNSYRDTLDLNRRYRRETGLQAFFSGRIAQSRGIPRAKNPFTSGSYVASENRTNWYLGWDAEQRTRFMGGNR
jgi:hypothetical protein